MINTKQIGYIILCIAVTAVVSICVGVMIIELVHTSPISKKTNYLYTGKIVDVHFMEVGIGAYPKMIIQFESGKTFTFNNHYYEIRKHQNATINYSVNNYDKMFFNDITYKNN